MKSNIKIAAIALAVLGLAVACKGKAEPVEDTTPTDTILIEEVVDTMIDTVAVEEVEATPAPAKKAVKKAEKKEGLSVASSKDNTTIGDKQNTTGKMGKVVSNNANLQQGSSNSNIEKNETTTMNKMGKVAAGKK